MNIFSQKAAVATGRTMAPPGPRVPVTDAIIEAESLRTAAYTAAKHVAELSKLSAIQHWDHETLDQDINVLIVDRPGWVEANVQSVHTMLQPALQKVANKNPQTLKNIGATIPQQFSGAQVGTALAFLSTKVLGQYEPYASRNQPENTRPRLLLVAPNIMTIRQELDLNPQDFQLWVSLHEVTHAAQFAQAPWLADHILDTATSFVMSKIAPSENLTTAEQEEHAQQLESKITGVMSLLEGHANFIMDGVNRKLVPSVRSIRKKFDKRATQHTWLSQLLRKLFALDAKAKQYKVGQTFVTAVVKQVGIEQFNTVWETAENLPTADELTAPEQWVKRILTA